MFRTAHILLLFGLLVSFTPPSGDDDGVRDTKASLWASMIYNFSTLADWPTAYKSGEFVVVVYGSPKTHKFMSTRFKNRRIGNQRLVVKKASELSAIPSRPQVVFVSNSRHDDLPKVMDLLAGKSTMIITNHPSGLKDGAVINLTIEDGKDTYEISKSNAKKRNLVLADKLLRMAKQ